MPGGAVIGRFHGQGQPPLSEIVNVRCRELSRAGFVVFAMLLLANVSATPASFPQEQIQASAQRENGQSSASPEPGKPLERTLQGGEKHSYEIRVEAGQFLHVAVEQLGIDVALTLYTPDGKPIASMDSPNDNFGLEQISTIAETSGPYRLEVASGNKNVPEGRYRVTVEPARAPSDKDRTRITAERTFVEATQLAVQGSADSLRGAIQKYVATLPLWRTTGDSYEEALTQATIGKIFDSLGESQKALDCYAQALPLAHAAGDPNLEAGTLSDIGAVYEDLGEKQKALDFYAQALPLDRAMGNRSGEGITLNNIGNVYSALGQKQKALEYFHQALSLLHAAGDRNREAVTLANMGSVYKDLGEKQKALDYFNQSLPLHRAAGDRTEEAVTLSSIGSVYDDLG
jgi:tetratricopeptide (TPR) repeat protein